MLAIWLLILVQLVCYSSAYPLLFQFQCYDHPYVGGSTYVCPIAPSNCSTFGECRREMNAAFSKSPYLGIAPTRMSCTGAPDDHTYSKLFKYKEIRYCNSTAGIFSSDLDCRDPFRCLDNQQCSIIVCNEAEKLGSFFIMLMKK